MKKNKSYKPMIELKIMRLKRQITQAELARKIGVSQNTISLYEVGGRFPKRKNLDKLAAALECDVKDIV